jgi:hypothetical protein
MRLVPNSLHDEVAATLREQIFAGSWRPAASWTRSRCASGCHLAHAAARGAQGADRRRPAAARAAARLLRQRGDRADLDEIFPVIALLEGRCAYEAARNASDADLARARCPARAAGAATPRPAHQRLLRHQLRHPRGHHPLADNRWLAQVIADLRKILKLARLQQLHAPGRLDAEPVGAPGGVRGPEGARQRRRRSRHAHAPDAPARGAARPGPQPEIQGGS